MKLCACSGGLKCIDSISGISHLPGYAGILTVRKYQCLKCGNVYHTYETELKDGKPEIYRTVSGVCVRSKNYALAPRPPAIKNLDTIEGE